MSLFTRFRSFYHAVVQDIDRRLKRRYNWYRTHRKYARKAQKSRREAQHPPEWQGRSRYIERERQKFLASCEE